MSGRPYTSTRFFNDRHGQEGIHSVVQGCGLSGYTSVENTEIDIPGGTKGRIRIHYEDLISTIYYTKKETDDSSEISASISICNSDSYKLF